MKGIFFPTMIFILAFLVMAVIIGGMVWFFISPYNRVSFGIVGTMNQKFEEFAHNQIQKIPENSTIKNPLLNYTAENQELEKKIVESRKNDEIFWLIAPLIAFVLGIIFYTAWTQRKRGGIGA